MRLTGKNLISKNLYDSILPKKAKLESPTTCPFGPRETSLWEPRVTCTKKARHACYEGARRFPEWECKEQVTTRGWGRSRQYSRGCPVQPSVGWAGIFAHSHLRNDPHRRSFLPRPIRLNLHHARLARQVMTETTPRPIFRFLDQPSLHRLPPQQAQPRRSLGTPDCDAYTVASL